MNDFQKELTVFREKITSASTLIKELSQSNETLLSAKSKIDQIDSLLDAIDKRHQTLINTLVQDNSGLLQRTDDNWRSKMAKIEDDFVSLKDFYLEQKNQILDEIRNNSVSNDMGFNNVKIALTDVFNLEIVGQEIILKNTELLNTQIQNIHPVLEDIISKDNAITSEINNSGSTIIKHLEQQDINQSNLRDEINNSRSSIIMHLDQQDINQSSLRGAVDAGFASLEPEFTKIVNIQNDHNNQLTDSTQSVLGHLSQQDNQNELNNTGLKDRISNSFRQITASIAKHSEKTANQITIHDELVQKSFQNLESIIDTNQQSLTDDLNTKFGLINAKMDEQKKFFTILITLELLVIAGLIAYIIYSI